MTSFGPPGPRNPSATRDGVLCDLNVAPMRDASSSATIWPMLCRVAAYCAPGLPSPTTSQVLSATESSFRRGRSRSRRPMGGSSRRRGVGGTARGLRPAVRAYPDAAPQAPCARGAERLLGGLGGSLLGALLALRGLRGLGLGGLCLFAQVDLLRHVHVDD